MICLVNYFPQTYFCIHVTWQQILDDFGFGLVVLQSLLYKMIKTNFYQRTNMNQYSTVRSDGKIKISDSLPKLAGPCRTVSFLALFVVEFEF